jgi:hypothetical protein
LGGGELSGGGLFAEAALEPAEGGSEVGGEGGGVHGLGVAYRQVSCKDRLCSLAVYLAIYP